MSELILPTKKVPAGSTSPRNLIIFSKPKTGKTELAAALDNALLLDLEEGSDFVSAIKLKARSVADIKIIGKKIREASKPYDYIVVDTITALEEIVTPYAEDIYSKTPMGMNWFKKDPNDPDKYAPDSGKAKYGSIINMPNGAGWMWQREAFTKTLDYIKTWAPRIILMGHVKDIQLDKATSEFTSLDLDLTGKLKRITTSYSDAVGYLYRVKDQNFISFKTSDEVSCGARAPHLSNNVILISEKKDNKLTTYWDKIFID